MKANKDPLFREKEFLRSNQKALSEKYLGKYLLIKGEKVHGAYDTFDEGVEAGAWVFGAGPFLVRSALKVEDPEAIYIPVLSLGIPTRANT